MKLEIYSRKAILERMQRQGLDAHVAVISFYTPRSLRDCEERRVDFSNTDARVFYVGIPDIDRELLADFGYSTENPYLAEADALAEFIYRARADHLDIICQCDHGQSRSAACAAAILQHFARRGIEVFVDYRYYPNQLVYHKIFDALQRRGRKKA